MKCYKCGKEDVPVYRTGPKGVDDPRWACEGCMKQPPDPEIKELVDVIAKADKKSGVE